MPVFYSGGRIHRNGRKGFKQRAMTSTFGTPRRFARATERMRARGSRAPRAVFPVVVPGITRQAGFFGRYGVGGELKFHDIDVDDPVVAAGANIFLNSNTEASLVRIAQSTTESTRIGRKCTIRMINWRFQLSLPALDGVTTAPNGDTIRVILYLDKQCNGAAAVNTDILEDADFQSFNNLANKSRFRTLMDRTYSLTYESGGGNGTTQDWAQVVIQDTLFKKVNIPIEYDNSATTGALATIKSNNIGVLFLSNTGTGGFVSKMRLRFADQ